MKLDVKKCFEKSVIIVNVGERNPGIIPSSLAPNE